MSVTERAVRVVADNAGIMTLDGTNTWILREPGAARSVVVDPGPDDADHLAAVLSAAGEVALVLYTHWHPDHTEAIDRMVELTGAPARAVDAAWCRGADPVVDGEQLDVDGLRLEVVTTPGHTADSMCLLLTDEGSLLTGDTILGRGTTIIAHPDGSLGPYLDSLARIRELVEEGVVSLLLPAHGPVPDDAAAHVDFYLEHRADRLDQVRRAVEAGAVTAAEVVATVYADVDRSLWPAAERSVEAQLEYLRT
ncbi:metallo-beta-lactamase domain protein [Aeromicrobium marinum DSM 15272]|uniref:Metallo-beta-lactamase domain protein n=1 Tax=Aeromicrobium marinum DSM 15272 TaxID=585531 RepID=E2SC74_9ACTN|nr:MBL fold metallo-hydrolase [Aeromicrobium marinum]EFQ83360.1 metallo-beta-lactamase domain protein [Aeromicrobium marinum DSM 15272]